MVMHKNNVTLSKQIICNNELENILKKKEMILRRVRYQTHPSKLLLLIDWVPNEGSLFGIGTGKETLLLFV